MYYFLQNLLTKIPITIFFEFDFDYLKNKLSESICKYVLNVKTKTLPFVYDCPSDLIVDSLNEKLIYSVIVNCFLFSFFAIFTFMKNNELKSIRNNVKTLDEMITEIKKNNNKKIYKRSINDNEIEEKKVIKRQKVLDSDNFDFNFDSHNKFLETFNLESFVDNKTDIENIKKWNNALENEIKLDNEVKENEVLESKKENSFVDVDLHSEEEYEKVN